MSSTVSLSSLTTIEACVDYARLVIEELALRRELRQIKSKREQANQRFANVQKQYQDRISSVPDHLHWLLHNVQPMCLEAVKAQYEMDDMPENYVLLKQADLLKHMRNQELLDSYKRVCREQSNESVRALKQTRRNLIIGLGVQQDNIKSVESQLIEVLTQKLVKFSTKYGSCNNMQPSSLAKSLVQKF